MSARTTIRSFARLPASVTSVATVFGLIVLLQVVMAAASLEVLSSVNGYVAGESLYSKGQKDALLHLQAWLQSHAEADYRDFAQALVVPEADAQARRALLQPVPDVDTARVALLAGQNDPADIDGMIRLFVHARTVPFMARAIRIWTDADDTLAVLRTLVETARQDVYRKRPQSPAMRDLATRIPALNERLTGLERDFSEQLGQASHLIQRLLLGANLCIAAFLWCLGALYVRRTLRMQRRREAEMTELVSAVGDVVLTVDGDRRVVLFNRAAEHLFGCPADIARGSPVSRFLQGQLPDPALDPILGGPESLRPFDGRRADGSTVSLEASLSSWNTARGAQVTIVCRDVTERQSAREHERAQLAQRNLELEHKAYTDALTGLPNREALEQRLQDTLEEAQHGAGPLSVLFLDLDGFKAVNDTHGHHAGDDLLRQAADRLRRAIRRQDEVFRVSGDEFVVVLTKEVERGTGEALAERVLVSMRRAYTLGGAAVRLTASIGIAYWPDHGSDSRSLLRAADASMYLVKQGGKDAYHVGALGMGAVPATPALVHELERAVQGDDELVLHYQPIIDARTNHLVGAEALVRWRHPSRGLLSPSLFIPLAETHGLCDALGDWVLRRAVQHLASGGDAAPPWVTVNLSASQLLNPYLPEQIEELLLRHGVSPTRLGVELTESMAMRDLTKSQAVLQAIRETGVSICLDDFGTGYSSLSQLHRMPVDKLKIDRSFVEHLPQDAGALRIVEAIAALSRAMRISTVAEGVETDAHVRTLRELGVDAFQGVGIARPMPWEELLAFGAAWAVGRSSIGV
jgi:diguanylate cyclase (GGDEF)-like protein/PAS domain S-box-containing protein